jgi:hypothetical protein
MGAVLEMTMRHLSAALLALTTALAACGQDQAVNPFTTAADVISKITGPQQPPLDIRASFTPEVLATVTQPLLAAEMPVRKANATMVLVGENAGHRTWVAADGIMLITKDGILTGTRGFGRDLMVSNVSAVLPALRAGSGTVLREMSRINDEGHVIPTRYSCTITQGGPQQVDLISRQVATQLVTETCTDTGGASEDFTNRYWLDGTGRIRQSDQWVGPRYGHALMYQLVD